MVRRMAWALVVAAVAGGCGDGEPEGTVVARAGESTLTVDEAAALLVDQEAIPARADVVETLAELWIDYTLLATAVARDSTFAFLELEPLVRQQLDQEMILRYRDSLVQVDTAVTDEELRAAFEEEAPGARIRARHVLLGYPPEATPAQRDSVRAEAEALRERILSGASFEEVARERSQDPGSAPRGGDLGFFGRGDMVRPFEEAAFALEPGEVSPVVESPFGVHLIRLEERRSPGFDEVREEFRARLVERRTLKADSIFVAELEADVSPEVSEGAPQLVRELAAEPGRSLPGRASRRALAAYDGGAYTAGEFQRFIQGRDPRFRSQIEEAEDGQIADFLQGMVRRELLVDAARNAGLEPEPEVVDSLVEGARDRLREVARRLGVLRLDRAPGEALQPAVDRAVEEALLDVLTGATDPMPLGQLAFQLRRGRTVLVSEEGVGEVVLQVGRERAGRAPSPAEGTVPASPPTPADTGGG